MVIFIIVGIGLIIYGVFSEIKLADFKKNAEETVAIVTKVDRYTNSDENETYTVYVSYEVNGITYNSSYTTKQLTIDGSNEKIYYDKSNPESIRKSISVASEFVPFIIGAIFIAMPIIIIVSNKLKN